VASDESFGIQAADLIAWSVRRYHIASHRPRGVTGDDVARMISTFIAAKHVHALYDSEEIRSRYRIAP
jgi:hypothetical protein